MAYYPKIRRFIVSLCLLVLIGSQGITASAMVYTPPEDQTEPSAPEYIRQSWDPAPSVRGRSSAIPQCHPSLPAKSFRKGCTQGS